MARCPVCEARIAEPVPPYCDRCGWDLANDITLVTSVHEIPEKVRSDYLARVKIARANWSRQRELEKKLAEQEASKRQKIDEVDRSESTLKEQEAPERPSMTEGKKLPERERRSDVPHLENATQGGFVAPTAPAKPHARTEQVSPSKSQNQIATPRRQEVICTNCGSANTPHKLKLYCENCLQALPPGSEACPGCSRDTPIAAVFCRHCGARR